MRTGHYISILCFLLLFLFVSRVQAADTVSAETNTNRETGRYGIFAKKMMPNEPIYFAVGTHGGPSKNEKAMMTTKKPSLIAGHTHEPVTELQKKYGQAAALSGERAELEKKIADKRAEPEFVRASHGDSQDDRGIPCYFNTGCCSFADGDVTGIEIVNGDIKLVRWPDDTGRPRAKELESASISEISADLEKNGAR